MSKGPGSPRGRIFDHPEDNPRYLASTAALNARVDAHFIAYIRETDRPALIEEKKALLARVVSEFADIPYQPAWAPPRANWQGRTLGELAGRKLEALRPIDELQPGRK